jgi:acyl transferase domain-containing protein/acyl carrier protein
MNQVSRDPALDSVAVIGMKGRFPGASSVEELWRNLREGRETITTFSEAEIRAAGVDPSYLTVPGYVNRGSVLEAIDQFDAGFFGFSARDAETIDPQQRLFLESAWECLEEAGHDPGSFPGLIGVFAGSDQSSYLYQIFNNIDLSAYGYGGMMAIGNEKDYLATQLSYKLDLRGPSLNVQTSCSTSLVTVCVACQNLVHGYCDMALAGGVAVSVPQKKGYWYQPGGIVSPDGHCRAFDAKGQGTVVGNGLGIVLLRRLADALADGDRIEAVIKGFALNNDGSGKVGYTAPSVDGQARAVRAAQRMAGVEPDTIGYIEAHGTATALGDPIEVAGLTQAFREGTAKRQFCAIGSLKSNVGHLSSAAGVSGLIKGVLAVKHGQIPGTLHYEKPNPEIDFASSPFFVASSLTDWPLRTGPRRAGVSSFGVGGTNAHLVLEQAPPAALCTAGAATQVLVLSARTAGALERTTDNLAAHLEATPDLDLADVAFTSQAGRKAFAHRRSIVFDRANRDGLLSALKSRDPERVTTGYTELSERPVVFMFSGQGTQYVGMGQRLYVSEASFRADVDGCCELLKGEIGLDLRDILYARRDNEEVGGRLRDTAMTQPALFTTEYALARLWMRWGCQPNAMLGHSIGEYVAACLAGVMSLKDALSVVAMRGRLMGSMEGGSMLAVPLPEAALGPWLDASVSLAAVNAPAMCVLSGQGPAIARIERKLAAQNVPCSKLHTSHAFHSSMMDPMLGQFVERLRRVELRPPEIACLSNLTGAWITPELATSPEYWAAHLRQTVRFADNLRELMVFPDLALIEVGPGQTLSGLARMQGSRAASQLLVPSLPTAHESTAEDVLIRNSLSSLWMNGVRIDWRGLHGGQGRRTVSLPTYPFERQRFWLGPLETEPDSVGPPTTPDSYGTPAPRLETAEHLSPPATPTATVDEWFSVPSWKPALPTLSSAPAKGTGHWLVLADSGGLGEEIARLLRDRGLKSSIAVRGGAFSAQAGRYALRPTDPADFQAMLGDLQKRGESPSFIVHLWSVDDPPAGLEPAAAFDEAQQRGYLSVVALAQGLAKVGAGSGTLQIAVVTERLQSVLGDETLRSREATVSGACKVISQEHPGLRCRWVDIVSPQPTLAEALIDELGLAAYEPVVAYRKGRRWIESYESVRLEPVTEAPALLEDGGVYLITGGLGRIGLVLAEAIARDVKAKLVLLGRTVLPPRSDWNDLLTAPGSDAAAMKIRKLRALEALGAEVMVEAADLADPCQVQAALAAVRTRWGKVDGVIHGAAHLAPDAFGPVEKVDRRSAQLHFAAKDKGLLALESAMADQPPKFWLMLSSMSAVLGGLGLASYAASNAFLDAEAQRMNAAGSLAISINWDAWSFASSASAPAIDEAHGADAFRRILAARIPRVVVAASPLGPRIRQWLRFEGAAPAAVAAPSLSRGNASAPGTASKAVGASHSRPELSSPYVSPRDDTETRIAQVWAHFLGVEPIGVNDKFFELGGHSLLAIQLLGRLREIFDIDIPVQRLFEAPTVAQLAQSIRSDLQDTSQRRAAPAPADQFEEMLKLVEDLSDAEVDALLADAGSTELMKGSHV